MLGLQRSCGLSSLPDNVVISRYQKIEASPGLFGNVIHAEEAARLPSNQQWRFYYPGESSNLDSLSTQCPLGGSLAIVTGPQS